MRRHAPFYRPKDLVNDLNGVPIPKPKSFDENLQDYKGKPRAVADADNKVGFSEVYQRRSAITGRAGEGSLRGAWKTTTRNVGALWQELERQGIAGDTAVMLSFGPTGSSSANITFYDKRLMYEPSIRVSDDGALPGTA